MEACLKASNEVNAETSGPTRLQEDPRFADAVSNDENLGGRSQNTPTNFMIRTRPKSLNREIGAQ